MKMRAKICIPVAASMLMALLGACTVNVNGDKINLDGNISYTEGTNLTEEENLTQDAGDVTALEIVNSAGNINITRSDSNNVSVKITKKVKGTDENEKKEIMGNIKIEMNKDGDKLTLSARSKDESGSYIWDWVSRLYKSVTVTMDYDIKVPEGVRVYKIDNTAGNTSLDAVSGEISIKQNAGDIRLTGVSLEGNSSFAMNAGNIELDAAVNRAEEVKVAGTAGNINIKIPEGSGVDLDTNLLAGNLSGSFLSGLSIKSGSYKQEINGGGTRLLVTLTAGNVIIDGR